MVKKLLYFFVFVFSLSLTAQTISVDCGAPLNDTYCYGNNENTTLEFQSDDGSPLNFTINSGNIELFWDDLTVFDSDGTILFDLNTDVGGNGNYNLAGTSFQSTGDSISFQIQSDGSISCASSGTYFPIDYTVSCATCVNPTVNFELISDCLNAPQFFIDVDITDLGSATSLEVSDSEGTTTQTITQTGVVQVGPFPNGSNVTVDVSNLEDANCLITSGAFSQEFCTLTEVECSQPFTGTYCYGNNEDTTLEFVSDDGTELNLTFDAGAIEVGFDSIFVLDTDGTVLFDGDGELAGLSFQSTGDTISFQITSDGSVSCATGQRPEIEYTVACATCVNPTVNFELISDCLNAPQFFIDVDITDLGSATSLEVSDSEGVTTQVVTQAGVVQVGPFANDTDVTVDVLNLEDANCLITSNTFNQEFCTLTEVFCDTPLNDETFCYGNNEDVTLEYISEDGSVLNLSFQAGTVQLNGDNFIVFDSDGSILYDMNAEETGFGAFDISGLSFQSTGDSISFQIISNAFTSCQSTATYNPFEYSVVCATCVNPVVDFELVSDCLNAPQFFVEADISSLGSATSVEVSDSQGVTTQTLTEAGIVQLGPFPNGTDVTVDVLNLDDANCLVTSNPFSQEFCTITEIDCGEPFTGTYCYGNNDNTTLEFVSDDGTPLNFTFDAGAIEVFWDSITVFDSDGTILFDGDGELAGLSFQSTGDTISFQITSDGSISCATGQRPEIEYTVACATCVIQDVSFQVVDDCASGQDQFFIDVDISDVGSALTLDLTDNQGNEILGITETGVQQFGPYANGTNVQVTVTNVDDGNCIVESGNLTQLACPPNNNSCDNAEVALINPENLCLELNAGTLFQAGATSVVSSCHPNILQDVWFEFEATSPTHTIAVIPEQSGFFGPSIGSAIYADDCGSLTELFCSTEFDNFGNSNSMVAQDLTPGETYYLRIYNFGGAELTQANGNFDLCITTPQFFEENDLCADLQPFCAPADDQGNPVPLVFPNGYFYLEQNLSESGPDYGCLFTQPNPAWFYITVEQTGVLEFEIIQSTAFDQNGQVIGDLLDVDFIAYGPFGEPVDNCDNLSPIVDCSFSAAAVETMVFPNAVAGEVYIVLITNFNQSPGYISLVQTNFGVDGGGTTDCSDVFGIVNGCASEGVILTSEVEEGTAYQWFILDNPDADSTDPSNYVPVENGEGSEYTAFESGNYYVLSQSADGSFLNEFFTVRLSEEPELAIDLNHNLCEGETLTLDATPINSDNYSTISYQWFDQDGIIDGAVGSVYTVTEVGLHEVHITTAELLGSSLFECTTVFQINVDGAEFVIDLGEDQSFCAATEPQTIVADVVGELEPDSEVTYLWNTDEETQSIQVTESGIYSVTVTIDGCSKTEEVIYVFNEIPLLDTSTEIFSCTYPAELIDVSPINSESFTSISYQWLDENGEIADANTSEFAFPTPGNYTVEITAEETQFDLTFECVTAFDFTVVGAQFEIDLGEDRAFCDEAEPQTITANLTGTVTSDDEITYQWSNGSITESIQVTETGTYEVEVTVNGCTEVAVVEYIFDETPVINLPTEIISCDLSSVVLDATPQNVDAVDTTFEWSFNGALLENEFIELISADDYGFGTYQLIAYSTNEECLFSQEIEVAPRFVSANLTLDSFDNLFCPDEEVLISAEVIGVDNDSATYTWFVNGVVQPAQTESVYTHIVGSDTTNPNQDVIAVSVNVGGDCLADTVEVELQRYNLDNCIIPEGMSPDGINHTLDLRFLAQRSGIRSLEIFNRYGKSVFKQNNYTNEFIGQNQNGSKLVTGTYFYVIKFNQEDPVYGREQKGWIYLNREQQ